MLRRQIAEGTLAPGMPTPSITTLSQQYGHARQTCAKALRILEDEGLLTRIPGLGYYVTGRTPPPPSRLLTQALRRRLPLKRPETSAPCCRLTGTRPRLAIVDSSPAGAAASLTRLATHSTWWVIGNASNARRPLRTQPRAVSSPMSRASVAGSHDTYAKRTAPFSGAPR